jgi:membrane protease YdiL (CAAX protease family)
MYQFIKQALAGENQWWKYIFTIFMVFFFIQIGSIPLIYTAYIQASSIEEFQISAQTNFMNLGINANLFLFWMIFSFLVGLITLLLCVKWIHHRYITSIITARKKIDWSRILFGFLVWGFIAIATIYAQISAQPENYVWNFELIPFITLVFIALFFIPFQTTLEELLFRGYLMQGLGLVFKSTWMPLLITSVGFGLLHGANPEVAKLGNIVMIYYIGTGFLFGVTTLMDEGTELAIGMHAANNIVAAIFVTSDWMVFQTDALYKDISEPNIGFETLFPVFIVYPILLLVFSKKYQWSHWKQRLFGFFSDEN